MARRSYYELLEVDPRASAAEIKAAYRRLARTLHPDQNADPAAAEAFKAIVEAYEVLGDPASRVRYDRFHWVPQGAVYADTKVTMVSGYRPGPGDYYNAVKEAVQERMRRKRGEDLLLDTEIAFFDAVRGTTRVFELPRRSRAGHVAPRRLEFTVPAGVRDGQRLRWRGEGAPGVGGAASGDLTVTVHVQPHPHFKRIGDDLHVEVWLQLSEALTGGSCTVEGPHDVHEINWEPRTADGHQVRIPGMGVRAEGRPAGSLICHLRWSLPSDLDDTQLAALQAFEATLREAQEPDRSKWAAWLAASR